MKRSAHSYSSEQGSAGAKFLVILAILLLVAHAGYNYVPVAYEGENFKQEMQTAVVNALALPPNIKPLDNVTRRLERAAAENNIPSDAFMEVKQINGVMHAHVAYQKQIGMLPFGLYDYTYRFDHTATPTGFLMKDR